MSNLPLLVLSSVPFLLLVVFSYLKNRVLSTLSEPSHCLGKKGGFMREFKNVALFVLASVSEVVVALGASLLASVGPLSKVNSGILNLGGAQYS